MNFAKPHGSAEIDEAEEVDVEGNIRELVQRDSIAFRQAEDNGEVITADLNTLLRRVSASSTREIDNLIGELRTFREKLQADGDRVQRDIAEYTALNQSVIQLTKIISDGMKKLPDGSNTSGSGSTKERAPQA
jgi:hypothetical protein